MGQRKGIYLAILKKISIAMGSFIATLHPKHLIVRISSIRERLSDKTM